MGQREQWRKVLDAEFQRWSTMSTEELLSTLHKGQAYEVQMDGKEYQVEVELLEDTDQCVHVIVSVDDGSLPWSIAPVTGTFVRERQ
jgi:hypothetical protein